MFFHFVKKGDSVYKLSKEYNVPINQIIQDNNLEEPYELLIGECLIINPRNKSYIVKEKDSLDSISKKFSLSKEKILKDNSLTDENSIKPGLRIHLDYDNLEKVNGLINGYCYQGISNKVLNNTLPTLSYISPFAYRLKENGNLVPLDDQRIITKADNHDTNSMLVVANIKESGGFSTSLASKILNNQNAINTLINDINSTKKGKNYQALCIDFEYVNEDEKNLYTEFIKKVKEGIGDIKLFVALAPKNSDEQKGLLYTAHDYYNIGKIVDYVILMTYEWGYTFGEPMPVAPLDQVRRVIRYAKSKIDESKIIMGVPNYGYDWTLPYQKGSKAESISNVDAISLAKKYNVEIKYDSQSQTPYFNYKKDGKLHVVHFDDACSINSKINLAIDENIKGLSIWTVTTYFPQLILLIDYYFNIEK